MPDFMVNKFKLYFFEWPCAKLARFRQAWRTRPSLRRWIYIGIVFLVWRYTFLFHWIVMVALQAYFSGLSEQGIINIKTTTHTYFVDAFRPLPSDGYMIRLFQEHRQDFERLIELHREDDRNRAMKDVPDTAWWATEEGKAIKQRLGIYSIDNRGAWMPDPYSIDWWKRFDQLPIKELADYESPLIRLDNSSSISRRHVLVNKGYYYIPQTPRIEDGWLLWPPNPQGRITEKSRVVGSTDWTPWFWQSDRCVYRVVEWPHWYIEWCRNQHPNIH